MPTFSSSPKDEIKSRLDIVELIKEYLPHLKQAGANWKTLCPFHSEKTPSFMVSLERQIWHCFGCGEGGDIFSFIIKMEGVEFPEALRILARKAGVVLRREDPELSNKRTHLIDINETAANFFHEMLLKSLEAQLARDYLKERGVLPETIEDFKIGFASFSWETLNKFLVQKNFSEEEIFLAGLTIKRERGAGFYDRFRARLMFPVKNVQGSIVGFGGRLLPSAVPEETAKYINTPQTLLYDKSKIVYNLESAKQQIRKEDLAVLVEGYMDVIASHQAGITNVVASSGTALTQEQVRLLKRYSQNLAIAFDTDPAGEKASERGIDMALEQGMNIKIVELPEGKDPDECIRANPTSWPEAIKKARSIMEYYFTKTLAKLDLTQVEDKKQASRILLRIIGKIADKIEQNYWIKKLANSLEVPEEILREAVPQAKTRLKRDEPVSEAPVKSLQDKNLMLSERLLALTLKYSQNLAYLIDHLPPEAIENLKLRNLYKDLIISYTNKVGKQVERTRGPFFDLENFRNNSNSSNLIDKLILLTDKDFIDFDDEKVRAEIIKIIKSLKKDYILSKIKRLEAEIKEAEAVRNINKVNKLSQDFNNFVGELAELG